MANNKVELADGTVLIDLTGDTAVASDVAQGKTFHLADGTQAIGTNSGGGLPASITAGDTPVIGGTYYADISRTSMTEATRITIKRAGTYRFKWAANIYGSSGTYQSRLYKNGTGQGSTYSLPDSAGWGNEYSVDLACNAGDVIAVYGRGRSTTYPISIIGFIACINWDNGF